MADNKRIVFILQFSKTLVNIVDHSLFPEKDTEPDQNELSDALKHPLNVFLDRHKMELFFLYREELARFKKDLDEKSFQELLESMVNDLKADDYNVQVLSYFLIVVSFFAVIAKRNGLATALRTATRVVLDTIQHFENNNEGKNDALADIINSLVKITERILAQKASDSERNEE